MYLRCQRTGRLDTEGCGGGKWILGSIITGDNIVQNAIKAMKVRTSSVSLQESRITYFDVLRGQFPLSEKYAWVAVGVLA